MHYDKYNIYNLVMTKYSYGRENWPDYDTGSNIEWCLTNGLGSYCSGSLIGSMNRTHQGYLVASLYPPTHRYVTLERIKEYVAVGEREYDLDSSRIFKKGSYTDHRGFDYLSEVTYDDASVTFKYECDDALTIEKTLSMKRDSNATAIAYDIFNHSDKEASLILTPMLNYREHGELTYRAVPKFNMLRTGNTLSLVPRIDQFVRIDLAFSGGGYTPRKLQYESGTALVTQIDLEEEGLTSHFTPCEISVSIPPHSDISYSVLCHVVCSESLQGYALLQDAGDYFLETRDAHKIFRETRKYYEGLADRAADRVYRTGMSSGSVAPLSSDDVFLRLALSADHFLCKRNSTGTRTILAGFPWFTDWGRDTMIAFTGLTLCTRRYEEAGQILFTFAHYARNGLIPNMFPDDGTEPLYNTADASLWFFIAVYRYIKYLKDDPKVGDNYLKDVMGFVRKDLFPTLIDITERYITGTDYSIYMEDNGLIHAGSDLDQVTWMDVRVGDKVMTPRHGCPVEINALWYNAVCIMEYLCKIYGYDGSRYASLAGKIRSSFTKAFWNDNRHCLYDVVVYDPSIDDYSFKDPSIRPNQVIAIALPFSVLTRTMEKSVLDMAERKLYTGVGLRSLSADSADYHGQYRGALTKRDEAYHQGTAWSYLLGSYITAYRKVNGPGRDCTSKILSLMEPILTHMSSEGDIGGISEVFDGDAPFRAGGCYNQAWSVGEILRAYVEDVLPYK